MDRHLLKTADVPKAVRQILTEAAHENEPTRCA